MKYDKCHCEKDKEEWVQKKHLQALKDRENGREGSNFTLD